MKTPVESVSDITTIVTQAVWKKMGNNDSNLPQITPDYLRQWVPEITNDDYLKLFNFKDTPIDTETRLRQMPKETEPDNWMGQMWYRIRRLRIQHAIDVPTEIIEVTKNVDISHHFNLKEGTIESPRLIAELINTEETKPRTVAETAFIAILSGWNDEPNLSYFKEKDGISSLEDGIVAIHRLWTAVNEKHKGAFHHPIGSIIEAYLKEATARQVTQEYNRKHPASILKHPMGSIQDLAFIENDTAILREFNMPDSIKRVQEAQMTLLETEFIIPDVMLLEVAQPLGIQSKTKRGAVSHTLRIFFEALMALKPNQTHSVMSFTLGDLIKYLYPNGKFNRTNQLPYIEQGLLALHTHATIPYKTESGGIGKWRPVVVRNVIGNFTKNDDKIYLDVRLPPDAKQGAMIEKQTLRLLGQKSAPKFSAYLAACYLFDKYGTVNGKIIDPTRPVTYQNDEGHILDGNGERLYTKNGKAIKSAYHPDARVKLPREDNPKRIRYPLLSNDDLMKACRLQNDQNQRRAVARAKKHWEDLESDGIVRIEKLRKGWRIMPSENHIQYYRALTQVGKK